MPRHYPHVNMYIFIHVQLILALGLPVNVQAPPYSRKQMRLSWNMKLSSPHSQEEALVRGSIVLLCYCTAHPGGCGGSTISTTQCQATSGSCGWLPHRDGSERGDTTSARVHKTVSEMWSLKYVERIPLASLLMAISNVERCTFNFYETQRCRAFFVRFTIFTEPP